MDYSTKSPHGIYQARFQLPVFITSKHPQIQKEFKRSLRTKNRIQARRNLAIITNNYHQAIEQIQSNMPDLTQEEIEQIIKKAVSIAQTLDEHSVETTGYKTIDTHNADKHFHLDDMLDFIEDIDGKEIRIVIERYFENQKLLNSQKEEQLKNLTDVHLNDVGVELPNKAPVLKLVNSTSPITDMHTVGNAISFQKTAYEYWKREAPKIKNEKTKLETKGIVEKIIAICPDKQISGYTGKDTDDFLNYIDSMPVGLKLEDIKGKGIEEISALRERKKVNRLSDRQQKKFFSEYTAIINFAFGKEYIDTTEKILRNHKVKPTDDRQEKPIPFDTNELNRIFSGRYYQNYRKCKNGLRDYMHWLPLLGFFTGCRLNELCQLHLLDIRKQQGVLYIDINMEHPQKSLKNKESYRAVPVHSKLIELGFEDFIKMKRYGENKHMVFHTLTYSNTHRWHQRPSVNFSNYLDVLKIPRKRPIDNLLSEAVHFHSFRHGFETRLTDEFTKSNEESIHTDLIMGHSFEGAVKSGYNHRKKISLIPALKESIERLPIDDLDFSHIENYWN